MIEAVATCWFW